MKTGVVIVLFNTADFILKQIECIKRFCKDDHDIIVIDNSMEQQVTDAILYRIKDTGCIYRKTDANTGDSSQSHTFACNMAYSLFKDQYQYFCFLDHDNFPIKDFSVRTTLDGKVIGGIGQEKSKKYVWPGCLFLDNTQVDHAIVDFSCNSEYGLDTGGNLYRIVERYGESNCMFFTEAYTQNPYYQKPPYNYYTIINGSFMHFVAASNWPKTDIGEHQERINTLINILEEKIK